MEKKSKSYRTVFTVYLILLLLIISSVNTFGQAKMVLIPDTTLRSIMFTDIAQKKIIKLQQGQITDLRTAVKELQLKQTSSDSLLNESQFREEVLKSEVSTESQKTLYWTGQASKYKRQRNLVIAGVTVVVVGSTTYAVIRSLKR